MSLTHHLEREVSEPGRPAPRDLHSVKRTAPFRRWVRWAVACDLAAAVVATLSALLIRFGSVDVSGPHLWTAVLATLGWPVLMAASGAYELRASLIGVEELRRTLRSSLLLLAAAGTVHIVFHLDLSRGFLLALLPLLVALTALGRAVAKRIMARERHDFGNHHRVVAVGPVADVEEFCVDLLRSRRRNQVEVVGFVADDLGPDDPVPLTLSRLPRILDRDAIRDLSDHGVHMDLIVRAGRPSPDEMWALSRRAHDLNVTVAIAPHRHDAIFGLATSYVPLGATPLLVVETPTMRPAAVVAKAIFDRVVAAAMLVVLAPVLALIAGVIAVRDGRPVLFVQQRAGRGGAHFGCLKFRTMCRDAEAQLAGILDLNESGGGLFKIRDDPRVTTTGRWLRKHSLDELPQLINVLKGEMSLVGPRPLPLDASEVFDHRSSRRMLVKPGMTGLWQVEGRSDLPWDDGVYLDLLYIDHWSPLLDLVIIARTLRTVLRPSGAY